jgi:hypothetical protein
VPQLTKSITTSSALTAVVTRLREIGKRIAKKMNAFFAIFMMRTCYYGNPMLAIACNGRDSSIFAFHPTFSTPIATTRKLQAPQISCYRSALIPNRSRSSAARTLLAEALSAPRIYT